MVKSTAQFPEPETLEREWGREVILGIAAGKYGMKLIVMKAGSEGGLQKHHLKDEMGIMLKGLMEIEYDDGTKTLVKKIVRKGDVFHFPTGCVHKARAITACSYIEAGTPHFNDRVHCEADYGIEKEAGGLSSTRLEDVELR